MLGPRRVPAADSRPFDLSLEKVGTQSGGTDAVAYAVAQDADQEGDRFGVAPDGVASAGLARLQSTQS